jgi:NADH-quinone oxidoreductase subunit J
MISFLSLFFKLLLLFSGFMVLASKNPVHSVLFLILAFCNGAALLLLLGMEFLAITFLVVYAGAIAVLFLFIVMMLNLKIVEFRQSLLNHYPVSLFLLLLLGVEAVVYLSSYQFVIHFPFYREWSGLVAGHGNVYLLGSLLYTYYYLPFLVAGVILLVSMVGSIVLTFSKKGAEERRQQVYDQIVRDSSIRLLLS